MKEGSTPIGDGEIIALTFPENYIDVTFREFAEENKRLICASLGIPVEMISLAPTEVSHDAANILRRWEQSVSKFRKQFSFANMFYRNLPRKRKKQVKKAILAVEKQLDGYYHNKLKNQF